MNTIAATPVSRRAIRLLVAAGLVALSASALTAHRAKADPPPPDTQPSFNTPGSINVVGGVTQRTDAEPAILSDDAYNGQSVVPVLATTQTPGTCAKLPYCQEINVNFTYPSGAKPTTEYFTTLTIDWQDPSAQLSAATFAGSGRIGEAPDGKPVKVRFVTTPADDTQGFDVCVELLKGADVAYTVKVDSSLQAFTTPFQAIAPIPTTTTIPEPIAPEAPSTTTTVALPPPPITAPPAAAAPAPPPAPPDQSLQSIIPDNQSFQVALQPTPSLFTKPIPTKPPGRPNDLLLILTLAILPIAAVGATLTLLRRRRSLVVL